MTVIPKSLTIREAASAATVSEKTLRREIQAGNITPRKIRGCTRILDEELARWLRAYESNSTGVSDPTRSAQTPANRTAPSASIAGEVASSETGRANP